jgi:hypothetical protein
MHINISFIIHILYILFLVEYWKLVLGIPLIRVEYVTVLCGRAHFRSYDKSEGWITSPELPVWRDVL